MPAFIYSLIFMSMCAEVENNHSGLKEQLVGARRPHLVVLGSGIQQAVMDDGCHPLQHCQN